MTAPDPPIAARAMTRLIGQRLIAGQLLQIRHPFGEPFGLGVTTSDGPADASPQDVQRPILELVGIGRTDVVLAADLGVREFAGQQVQRDLQFLFIGKLRYACHKHRLLASRLPAAPIALRAPSAPANPF